MVKPDKRLWCPDESCFPFHLESHGGVSRRLIDFTVSPHTIAVLTSLVAMQFHNAVLNSKDQVRVGIGKTVSQTGLDEGLISLNGFLSNVIERGNVSATDNVAGFIVNAGNSSTIAIVPRPIRVILEPASYYIQQIGTIVPGSMLIAIHGYGFFEQPRD